MRANLIRLVAALAATVIGLSGCASRAGSDGGFVSGDGTITRVPIAQRATAPVLRGPTLTGESLDTSRFAGKVVVYNVWGSWCAPCRAEAPALVEAAHRSAGKAQFVGINTRDLDAAPAKAFVRAFGIGFPSFYDPNGSLLLEFGTSLPPGGIPSTVVVDSQGRIAARILGETSAATLSGLIDDVAAGR